MAYFKENAPKTEQDIANEIDRYIGNPGQALAYKIGQMKISELRARDETKLGDAFGLRAFHDELMATGVVPLSVLEARMDAWIEARAAKKWRGGTDERSRANHAFRRSPLAGDTIRERNERSDGDRRSRAGDRVQRAGNLAYCSVACFGLRETRTQPRPFRMAAYPV